MKTVAQADRQLALVRQYHASYRKFADNYTFSASGSFAIGAVPDWNGSGVRFSTLDRDSRTLFFVRHSHETEMGVG